MAATSAIKTRAIQLSTLNSSALKPATVVAIAASTTSGSRTAARWRDAIALLEPDADVEREGERTLVQPAIEALSSFCSNQLLQSPQRLCRLQMLRFSL